MLPLVFTGITSTNAMIKRLGGKRWRALHRPAYVAAIAGVIHYYMQVKADVRQPLAWFSSSVCCCPGCDAGLGSLPPNRLKYASGLFNMMRNLGGAIGIAACATILNDRTNLHFLRLAEHLNSTNAAMQGVVHQLSTKFTTANGGDLVHGHGEALKELWSLTYREARVQTFADAFLVIAVCLAAATLLVPLLRKVAAPPTPAANAH